jgi:transketolase
MLLYSLLYLTGYPLGIEEIRNFRQLGSRTAGHPEVEQHIGIETTTGPLGQGLANAVGMALAEKLLAQEFNRPGFDIVDHHTWVFLGDGCLMEGISHEVCSLAGTLGLGKLIGFYDDNGISIDGHVQEWFTDDTPKRFEAYGWHVVPNVNGHDPEAIQAAIMLARTETAKPSLICCKTVIGMGAPTKAGTHESHGAPLGEAEIAATRPAIGWHHPPFEIPDEVYAGWDARPRGAALEATWNETFARYRAAYPEDAAEFERRARGELPAGWSETVAALLGKIDAEGKTIATRKASQNAIEGLAPHLPELFGGSADLTGSNLTNWSGTRSVNQDGRGNYLSYGVREFGMAAMMNGITAHGGLIPYGGTFLMFSEYARNAIRVAALMRIRSILVFTHDSIGLGEDGPTHQGVEQTATLRLMPNLDTWRPCDTMETAVAWAAAIERRDGPSALVLSRQNLQFQPRDAGTRDAIRRGGYILSEPAGAAPQAVILATGSEVDLAMRAQKTLAGEGIAVRVVSMPCTTLFDRQDADYRQRVLPPGIPRVAVKAGVTDGWHKYVLDGPVIGLDRFGESAPAAELFEYFGITADNVAKAVRSVV